MRPRPVAEDCSTRNLARLHLIEVGGCCCRRDAAKFVPKGETCQPRSGTRIKEHKIQCECASLAVAICSLNFSPRLCSASEVRLERVFLNAEVLGAEFANACPPQKWTPWHGGRWACSGLSPFTISVGCGAGRESDLAPVLVAKKRRKW